MPCPQCQAPLGDPPPERCPACDADLFLQRVPAGLTVEHVAPRRGGYRSDAVPTGTATVTWRWWRPGDFRRWASALLLVLLDLLFFLALRYFVVEMESWTPVVLTSLFAGLPLVMFHTSLLQAATSRTVLTAAEDKITVKWGPWLGGERSLAPGSIVQVFAAASKAGAWVAAQLDDGNVTAVARHLTPRQARYIERLLEETLAVRDQPVQGELPANDKALRRPVLKPLLVSLLLLIAVGVAGYYAVQPTHRTRGVSIYPDPATFVVQGEPEQMLEFWTITRLNATGDVGLSSRLYQLAGRVHVLISLQDAGEHVTELRCDPFETSFSDWQSSEQGLTSTEWRFVSRMDDCRARIATAGPVRVTAELVRGPGGDQLEFERLELQPR